MRSTLNIKHTDAADLARQLRSAAAKLDAAALVPGADLKLGNARIQVAVPQENDIRAWARANGFPIGSRGVISNAIKEGYAASLKEARAAKRRAAAEKRALVSA